MSINRTAVRLQPISIGGYRPSPSIDPATDTDRFERRLVRSAERALRNDLNGDTVVYDFLAYPVPFDPMHIYRSSNAGTIWSSVVMKDDGGFWIREFVLRLIGPAPKDTPIDDLRQQIIEIAESVGPPAPNTKVWFRPKFSDPLGYGELPAPHLGAVDIDCHPDVYLDFLSEFLPTYQEHHDHVRSK